MSKKYNSPDRHIFALHYHKTNTLLSSVGKTIILENKELYHRMVHVLRFTEGSACILFDKQYHANVVVEKLHNKTIEVHVKEAQQHTPLEPYVILLLPVLKRQSLSEAVYNAVEVGVNEIQLITTQKVQRGWGGQKELERLQGVVIAACERSKQFSVPELTTPIPLQEALSKMKEVPLRIFYDAIGDSFANVSTHDLHQPAVVLIGPEGDLTTEEKETVKNNNFAFTRLAPTILRSPQAVTLGIGLLRALQY